MDFNSANSQKLAYMRDWLSNYDGQEVNLMEVCGSHTAAISKLGLPSLLSDKINLLSGPGCPVCVTPTSYIDRLIELSLQPSVCVCTFGDLIRVPGSNGNSLAKARAIGGNIKMLYSPFNIIDLAKKKPDITFIFAAVGFETTSPNYALLMDNLVKSEISNVKILTALKTMPQAIKFLCASGAKIDGFIAPGHVSVITGTKVFQPIADEFNKPFVVAGFKGYELISAIYTAVRLCGQNVVCNLYPSVVDENGNIMAQDLISKYFTTCDAVWRGMGVIPNSGLVLRNEFLQYDAGSKLLMQDNANKACHCGEVLTGKIRPVQCPLFGRACTPDNPCGACMVSTEGSCFQFYSNNRVR